MKLPNEQNGIRRPRLVKVDGIAEEALGHVRNGRGHFYQKLGRHSALVVHHHLDKQVSGLIPKRVVLPSHFFQPGIRIFIRVAYGGQARLNRSRQRGVIRGAGQCGIVYVQQVAQRGYVHTDGCTESGQVPLKRFGQRRHGGIGLAGSAQSALQRENGGHELII